MNYLSTYFKSNKRKILNLKIDMIKYHKNITNTVYATILVSIITKITFAV